MPFLRQVFRGFSNLFHPGRAAREAADEVASFYSETAAALEAGGLSHSEAMRAARVQIGSSSTALRESLSSYGWENPISGLAMDLRHILRRLRKTPGFTLTSIGTLALGLGASITLFSLIDGVLLKPLPFRDSDRLVVLNLAAPGVRISDLNIAPSVYLTIKEETRVFENVAMWDQGSLNVTRREHPEETPALFATHELLSVLGVTPQLGRSFEAADDLPHSEHTVMLSDTYWHTHFGADRRVIGQRLRSGSDYFTIIGVLPPKFDFLDIEADLLTPMEVDRATVRLGGFSYRGVGRLKPKTTLAQATGDVGRDLALVSARFPAPPGYNVKMFDDARIQPNLQLLKDWFLGDTGRSLWLLMSAAALVLTIACANVANLLLVRSDARQSELSVRTALGAPWLRIARELLMESLTLGAMAGMAGLGMAALALRLLVVLHLAHLPRAGNIGLDASSVIFALAAALVFSGLSGLIPVLRYARRGAAQSLSGTTRWTSAGKDRQRTRSLLVIMQVALAFILLVCSGLMIRTSQNLRRVDPGFFKPDELQTVRLGIPEGEAKEVQRVLNLERSMLEAMAGLRGVESVSISTAIPLSGPNSNDPVFASDKSYRENELPPVRRFQFIAPGYFHTLGRRMLSGRDLTWHDIYNASPVAIVSENTARDFWGSAQAAIGKRIRTTRRDDWREVIAVVADEHSDGVDQPAPSLVYWPLYQKNFDGDEDSVRRYVTFVMRTPRAGTRPLENEIQRILWTLEPNLPLAKIQTVGFLYNRSLAKTTFTLILLGVAGSMALILGIVGIYGVVSYSVVQRSREIGIRLALGAPLDNVTQLFLRNGLLLSAVGCGAGLAGALLLTQLMKAVLYGVNPADPLTYAAMSTALIAAAVGASYIPARRASHLDPVNTLRSE